MEYILRSLRAAFSGAVRQVATVTRGIGVSGNSILSRNQGFPAQYCSHGPDVFFVSLATFHAMHIWRGFYLCTLKKDVTLLRTLQKLIVTYMPSLELFFSLTPFRRHLLLTVGNGSGE